MADESKQETSNEVAASQTRPARSIRVRQAAAQVAVAASAKTGRPVDPRVKALAEMNLDNTSEAEATPRPARSLEVRKAAAQVAVAASAKTGRPVDPRVKALAELP